MSSVFVTTEAIRPIGIRQESLAVVDSSVWQRSSCTIVKWPISTVLLSSFKDTLI